MTIRIKGRAIGLLAIMLAACGTPSPRPTADAPTAPSSSQPTVATNETAAAPMAVQPIPPLTALAPAAPLASAQAEGGGAGAWGGAAAPLPGGWVPWTIHPSKKKTRYRIERQNGQSVLRADADGSASGLMTELSIDPNQQPMLTWRWRVDSLVAGADNADRHAEDSPVRVVLAFDGDKRTLPFRDQVFFEQARLFAGREMPYATLMYIWENQQPIGAVIRNPNTDRVRKIVVASGPGKLRQWQAYRRNIVEDYKLAFGKPPPGRLIGVAILTDTDNTRQKVTSWYGDIALGR